MSKPGRHILIVDDDRAVCNSLELLLKRAAYQVSSIYRWQDISGRLSQYQFDLVLLDMNFALSTTGQQGLKALRSIRTDAPHLPVILMTGWATVQLAVEGMKLGASDFIAKPWSNAHLLQSIATILALRDQEVSNKDQFSLDHIVGDSPELQDVVEVVHRAADTKANVLVLGESGTGKELVAEALHHLSSRKEQPFVKVNLGGLPTSLFESEMFGHRKGAFTDATADRIGRFEAANGGSIFLDEIGDLHLASQIKLLRVLQESTFEPIGSSKPLLVDVRVIAATNRNLADMVAKKIFREDLFYRLNLVTITLPPLRERRADIPLLVDHFIRIFREYYDRPNLTLSKEALNWVSQQQFLGNIRQLRHLIERATILSQDSVIGVDALKHLYQDIDLSESITLPQIGSITLENLEKKMISKALALYNNKVAEAAKSLGLTRSSLYRRIEKYNLLQ